MAMAASTAYSSPAISAGVPRQPLRCSRGSLREVRGGGCVLRKSWSSVLAMRAERRPGRLGVVAQAKRGTGRKQERRQVGSVGSVGSVAGMFPEAVQTFPWQRVVFRLGQRMLDLLWTSCGWLLLPVVIVSALSEVTYALAQSKEICVPVGLVVGSALAGIVKETVLEVSAELKDATVPWHLVISMVVFLLLKLPGPGYPFWARCTVPHIANGGVWQTWLYLNAWKKSRQAKASAGSQRS